MKGIIMAGGSGTRLHPSTLSISKQILPVFNKPMIYYPISVLMLAGIREIIIVTTPRDKPIFFELLGDGSNFGVQFQFVTQKTPLGLAQGISLAAPFLDNQGFCMVLGDNIFYGQDLLAPIKSALRTTKGATIFAYKVANPKAYGVVEISGTEVLSIEEKPSNPKSSYAITGLYVFDSSAVKRVNQIKPSIRGELEITDLHKSYLKDSSLHVEILRRGVAWLDMGSNVDLMRASNFIESIETRQGLKVACLEEIGLTNGWLTKKDLLNSKIYNSNSDYSEYLRSL